MPTFLPCRYVFSLPSLKIGNKVGLFFTSRLRSSAFGAAPKGPDSHGSNSLPFFQANPEDSLLLLPTPLCPGSQGLDLILRLYFNPVQNRSAWGMVVRWGNRPGSVNFYWLQQLCDASYLLPSNDYTLLGHVDF